MGAPAHTELKVPLPRLAQRTSRTPLLNFRAPSRTRSLSLSRSLTNQASVASLTLLAPTVALLFQHFFMYMTIRPARDRDRTGSPGSQRHSSRHMRPETPTVSLQFREARPLAISCILARFLPSPSSAFASCGLP